MSVVPIFTTVTATVTMHKSDPVTASAPAPVPAPAPAPASASAVTPPPTATVTAMPTHPRSTPMDATEIYKRDIEAPAAATRQPGESNESAISRYLDTAAGRAANDRYQWARAAGLQTFARMEEPVLKAAGPTTSALVAKAEAHRTADPSLTREQAYSQALADNPELLTAARAEGRFPVASLPGA